jgi:hypothetical protein
MRWAIFHASFGRIRHAGEPVLLLILWRVFDDFQQVPGRIQVFDDGKGKGIGVKLYAHEGLLGDVRLADFVQAGALRARKASEKRLGYKSEGSPFN